MRYLVSASFVCDIVAVGCLCSCALNNRELVISFPLFHRSLCQCVSLAKDSIKRLNLHCAVG